MDHTEALSLAARLREAIAILDHEAAAKYPPGTTRRDLRAIFDQAEHGKTITETISAWRSGKLKRLHQGGDPQWVLRLVSLIQNRHARAAKDLLLAYVGYVSLLDVGKIERLHRLALDYIPVAGTQLSRRLKRKSEWLRLAFLLELKLILNQRLDAFRLSENAWKESRLGYDVPLDVFYILRQTLFNVRERILSHNEMAKVLEDTGASIPLAGVPPLFEIFEDEPYVQQCAGEPSESYERMVCDGRTTKILYHSPQIDILLRNGRAREIVVVPVATTYRIPHSHVQFGWLAHQKRMGVAQKEYFNGFKVKFLTSLEGAFLAKTIEVQRTTYFATHITNWSCQYSFKNKLTGEVLALEDISGKQLSSMDMSSHIGVMALVLTSDNHLVSMFQDGKCAVAGSDLVPFGGSAEFLDIDRLKEKTLGHLVEYSMEREVSEEAVVPRSSIVETLVLGYSLDSGNGLKPDFFGLVRIKESWKDIRSNREEMYGGKLEDVEVDFSTAAKVRESIDVVKRRWNNIVHAAFLFANLDFLYQAADVVAGPVG